MRKSSPSFLITLAVVGMILGFALEVELARRGIAMFQLMPVYSIVLVLFGAALLGLAWPIRKMQKDEHAKKVSLFWAVRVLLLAQASGLAAALLSGFALGIFVWVVSKVVLPVGVYLISGFAILAGVALLIAALIAEHFCTLPPDDDQPQVHTEPTPTSPA